MAVLTMPYMIPLFLGMTFDARNSKPGVDIYDAEYVDNPLNTTFMDIETSYSVVSTMSEVHKKLDISGDLSLKIKAGMLNIEGKGSYLKNEKDYKNSVLVLTTLKYTSVVKAMNADAKPRNNWHKQFSADILGTHYVYSITYGAEMIASAKFVVHKTEHVEEVKGEVNTALGSGGSGNDLVAEGKLENLEKKLKGKASLEISYYGTVPLKSIPNTIDGLKTLVKSFRKQVEEAGLKDGIPLFVQLNPLTDIAEPEDQDKFEFIKNKELEIELDDFEENIDDLRGARLELTKWAETLPYELDKKYEKEIGDLRQNITDILLVHYQILWSLDVTKAPEQLQPAFDAYDYDDKKRFRRFDRLVKNLKKKVESVVDRSSHVSSDIYVQWGNKNCTGANTVVLYEGFTFSSAEEGTGGAAQYSCAPRSMEDGYDLSTERIPSALAGIRYTDFDEDSNPFEGPYADDIPNAGVPCAKCYSPDSASVAVFSAMDECPLTWVRMYKGYLMSARSNEGHTTEYICVDDRPSEPYVMDKQKRNMNSIALTTVHSAGSLPPEIYKRGSLLKCIVCAMKSNIPTF